MNFVEAMKSAFANYANFKGRAVRSEYWWFWLFNFFVGWGLNIAVGPPDNPNPLAETVQMIVGLAILVPWIAVSVRRLHDVDRRGWWLLLVVTIIGSPVVLYWLIKKGTEGPNRFGEDRLAALSASKTPDIVT